MGNVASSCCTVEHKTPVIKKVAAVPAHAENAEREEKARSSKEKSRPQGKEKQTPQPQTQYQFDLHSGEDAQSEAGQSEGGQSGVSGASTAAGSDFSAGSTRSNQSTGRSHEAKKLVKAFVKEMVRGRKLDVLQPSGQVRACFCSLNRALDTFSIKVGELQSQCRSIQLKDIEQMIAGKDSNEYPVLETISTPLDDRCVTLALISGTCISFRMKDIEQRDTFVMCLTMFSNASRSPLS